MTVLAAALSFSVYSLGLGDVQLQSKLNEPFSARINILSASAAEIGSLRVGLAGAEDWERAGLSPQSAASQLRFGFVATGRGNLTITLNTDEPVRDPLLVFLVDAAWDSGHLLREYTVFLDPDSLPSNNVAPVVLPQTAGQTGGQAARQVRSGNTAADAAVNGYLGQNYGPVMRGDNLSKIAERLIVGTDLTRYQMVWALFQANQTAFTNQNINLLNSGVSLQVPEAYEVAAISPQRAKGLVKAAASSAQSQSRVASVDSNSSASVSAGRSEPSQADESSQSDQDNAQAKGAEKNIDTNNEEAGVDDESEAAKQTGAPAQTQLSNLDTRTAPVDKLELLPLENPDSNSSTSGAADSAGAGSGAASADTAPVTSSVTSGRGAGSAANGDATQRESALAAENSLLRERISETEALLKEIRSLLAARSEQLSDLQSRLERVETNATSSAATQKAVQAEQQIGWFWWLLLIVAILILLALIVLLLMLTKRGQQKSTATDRLDAFEAELNAADHQASANKKNAPMQPLSSEGKVVAGPSAKAKNDIPEHLAHAMTAAPLMAAAVHRAAVEDDVDEATEEDTSVEAVEASEDVLEERESVDDAPLEFDVGSYAADAKEDNSQLADSGVVEGIALPALDGEFDDFNEQNNPDELLDVDDVLVESGDLEPEPEPEFEVIEPLDSNFDDEFSDFELPLADAETVDSDAAIIEEPGADLELDAPLVIEGVDDLAGSGADEFGVVNTELDANDAEVDSSVASVSAPVSGVDVSDFSGGDQVATKLDLARVYADMGDAEEAQSILDEVLRDGDDAQKSEAQNIIDNLV